MSWYIPPLFHITTFFHIIQYDIFFMFMIVLFGIRMI